MKDLSVSTTTGKINIQITFDGDVEKHFPSLHSLFHALQGELPTTPINQSITGQSEIITPDELCEEYKLNKSQLYSMTMRTDAESIPRYKIGKHLRFKRSEVEQWFDKQRG